MMHKNIACRGAFTLIELLIVVGIIAVLIGILVPAVNFAREASHTAKCLSNLRQIGTGMTQYAVDNDDCLVPGDTYGMLEGSNPGAGNWADILGVGHYVPTNLVPYHAGSHYTGDAGSGDNVFRCPNAVDTDLAIPGQFPTSQTDGRGRNFTVRGSDIAGLACFCWYATNTTVGKITTPMLFIPIQGMTNPDGTPLMLYHRLHQLKDNATLPLICDGVWMVNDDPNRINARHGNNQYTNILYADCHAESQKTSPLWPDVNWYIK